MTIKLKPCPFCGGEAKLLKCEGFDKAGSFKVECASTSSPICNCMPSTWFCDTEDEAIAMWNKRAEPEKNKQKHGKWIYDEHEGMFYCSECKEYVAYNVYNYCMWCGAKMDKKVSE